MSTGSPGETVLVTGASSQLGVFLLPRLRHAGFKVLALSRNAPDHPLEVSNGVNWVHPQRLLGSAGPLAEAVEARYLVSCGPLGLAVQLLESRRPPNGAGIERVVAFSSSSVISKAASDHGAEREQAAALATAEQDLKDRCTAAGAALLLLRPTLIYGCGLDRNISLLAQWARRFGFLPLAGKARGLRQPVHADDLAAAAVAALLSAEPTRLESPACGGSTLTWRQMAARIADCVADRSGDAGSRKVRLLTLPPGLMVALVRAAGLLGVTRGLNAEMVKRQNRNLVFDDSGLRAALAYRPRPFEPVAADFELPAEAAELQLAGRRPGRPEDLSSNAGT